MSSLLTIEPKVQMPPACTPRDIAVLRGLFESRLMSRSHIAAIYFNGKEPMTKKRLQKLAARRLVGERPRKPEEPKLHFLTKRGFELLKSDGHLSSYPPIGYETFRRRSDVSELTIRHEIAVMDTKAAFYKATANHPSVRIAEFSTWPRLFRFRVRSSSGRMAWLSPDAFIRLEETDTDGSRHESLFYAEIDRSTESLDVLRRKAAGYQDHFRTGGMAVRFGRPREDYKLFGFRTLWIFQTQARRDSAAQAFITQNPPVLSQAWMTTQAELASNPLSPIWTRPSDHRGGPPPTAIPLLNH